MSAGETAPASEPEHWTGYVVVSGPPASGKSTLARQLAPRVGLPLLSKDTIKYGLMTVIPVPDVATSRLLGRASVAALVGVAADVGYGVLESPWHRSRALPALRDLPAPVIEVFCRCDRDTAAERYRARLGRRGSGPFDEQRLAAELWNDEVSEPVAGGWPVVEVDTNGPVDVGSVVDRIRAVSPPARA